MLTSLWWLTLCLLQMTRIGDGLPQAMTMGRFLHTQGYGHVILKIQLQHMTKRNIFCSFLTSKLVVLLVVDYSCNGVNQIAQRLFWIEWLHLTLHVQFWCMKIARRYGKKSGTSGKTSVMTFRGNKPHIIKNQVSWRKGKVAQEIWWWMDERWAGVLPRIARFIQETQV